ncbi:HDOD domain-containing protein [Desulfovibrio mangrovi]|uniref:EAL and HDOD domain-containing protein n=1 Tax=Desulfovibrio mangrovi TaxID=2976983 RepID=UPI002245A215|nr:HDOD domain-containing protein [Desulfovibrio mangrovi]UZP65980.1 HDOD domain-containing protein [Desulfovibrio mangrovi]
MSIDCTPAVPPCYEPIFTARQPVFDRDGAIWGIELFFRHSAEAGKAEFDNPALASARVIADGFSMARNWIPPDARIFINVPEGLLKDNLMLALPAERCVPELVGVTSVSPELLDALKTLKEQGYLLALDNYTGQPELEPLLAIMDVVKVDVSSLQSSELFPLVSELRKWPVMMLATKVESKKIYSLCRSMGFSLFQGYYFGKPEVFAGRKVSSAEMVKLDIMKELHGDYDVHRLAELIKQDVSLSYRLLRYVNSPSVGLRQSVRALDQALVVLGERVIRHWLMVVLLADLNPSPGAQEVSFWSVQRARFLYLLAQDGMLTTYGSETMFLIGLFSRLDFLLGRPMNELVTELPLDGIIKDAYCGKKNFVRDMLDFLAALEEARWDVSSECANWLGIPLKRAAELSNDALRWATAVLDRGGDESGGEESGGECTE